jgi:hypothetical protein
MGETGRLQDWKDCCYYYCYRRSGRWSEAARAKAWIYGGGCRRIGVDPHPTGVGPHPVGRPDRLGHPTNSTTT